MPRRYYDYLPQYHTPHLIATIGSWILVSGILLMLGNLVRSLYRGEPAPANPWGGTTLEWSVPSPPPLENFEEIPHVDRGPYDHEGVGSK
jgi:cytochrome c oxidase subunit 1